MSETTPLEPAPAAGSTAATSAIAELLGPFQEEAAATRVAIEDRLREQRRLNAGLVVFVAVTAALVALVLVILIQNRQTSAKTRSVIATNAELSSQIADCTRVGGICYEQAQVNARKTIELLLADNKAIAQCARSTDTEAQLDSCVAAKLQPIDLPTKSTR